MRRRLSFLALVALALAGLGVAVTAFARKASPPPPSLRVPAVLTHVRLLGPPALVAHVRGRSVRLYARSRAGSSHRWLIEHRVLGRRIPLVLLVRGRRPGWIRVVLPLRPNGSTAWVRAAQITLRPVVYRIRVELRRHRLTAWRGDRLLLRAGIVGGARATPTPAGSFYVTERVRTPEPGGVYGPWALGLSAHSPVLTEFSGGDGQVAIHGTNSPGDLGADVSHGCVRVRNAVIRKLARLPLGTPVVIRR